MPPEGGCSFLGDHCPLCESASLLQFERASCVCPPCTVYLTFLSKRSQQAEKWRDGKVAEEMIISSKGTSCCPASTTSPGISFFIMQCQIYLKFWHGTDHALSIGRTPILTLIPPLSPLSSVYSLSFPAPFRLRQRGLCVPSIAPHMQTLTTDRKKTWHLATRGCCLHWSAQSPGK